jgi:ATP-dependent Zn protease
MNNPTLLIIGILLSISHVASAASGGDQSASDSLTSAVLGFLPIVLFLVILYFFFRRQMNSPEAKLRQQYVQRRIQHTQRVEELLERIATALEKNDKHVA